MNGRQVAALGIVGAAAAGLVLYMRRADAVALVSDSGASPHPASGFSVDLSAFVASMPAEFAATVEGAVMNWYTELQSGRGEAYAGLFDSAERANGLPAYMLARLAWQESRYRPDIISGAVKSSAGALGIMQIVPRWHPSVNPLDPPAAIAYAGKYLRSLYRQFGDYKLALMAYNWGPGNVSTWLKRGGSVPTETAKYQSQILADVAAVNPTLTAYA